LDLEGHFRSRSGLCRSAKGSEEKTAAETQSSDKKENKSLRATSPTGEIVRKALVRLIVLFSLVLSGTSFAASAVLAQNPSPEELKHKVEAYLRNLFAFGPETKLVVGDFKETGLPGLL